MDRARIKVTNGIKIELLFLITILVIVLILSDVNKFQLTNLIIMIVIHALLLILCFCNNKIADYILLITALLQSTATLLSFHFLKKEALSQGYVFLPVLDVKLLLDIFLLRISFSAAILGTFLHVIIVYAQKMHVRFI